MLKRTIIQWAAKLAIAAAFALTTTAQAAESPRRNSDEAGRGEDRVDSAASLTEIVVTARKVTERAIDVPSSISVISGAQLDKLHATQLTDIAGYVPGLHVDSEGTPGETTISLRGIPPLGGAASTVGIYLDDTPVGSSSLYNRGAEFGIDLLPYDVERIEVLRGPQGTLYGASSIGGLVKYVTVAPDLEKLEFRAGGDVFAISHAHEVGSSERASVNVPIVDGQLAVLGSFDHLKTPGYITDVTTGARDVNDVTQQGGRLALLWYPLSGLSIKLSGLWQSTDADDRASVTLDYPSFARVGNGLANDHSLREPFSWRLSYYAATVNWDLGPVTATSATSYSKNETRQRGDETRALGGVFPLLGLPAGLSFFQVDLGVKKWTQEFRLASNGSHKLDWLIGGFFTDEHGSNFQYVSALSAPNVPIVGVDPLALDTIPTTYHESALFGDATYHFTDRFDVGVGLRRAHNNQVAAINASGILGGGSVARGTSSEGITTYMISPRFHLTTDSIAYARVATGYRPGGPNGSLPGAPPEVAADRLTNYEMGWKGEYVDKRLALDVAAFDMDWKDIQLVVVRNGVGFVANAGAARSRGLEFSSTFRLFPRFEIGVTGALTNATLQEDAISVNGKAGDRLPEIPRFSGAVTAEFSATLMANWTARIGGGLRYVGSRSSDVSSAPDAIAEGSYGVLDLNADVSNDRLTVRLFVKNAADSGKLINSSLVTDIFGAPAYIRGTPLQPRTIGLGLDTRF
jgi:iron complex outermembrane receptor protein